MFPETEDLFEADARALRQVFAEPNLGKVKCVGCGYIFETDNEDDMVLQLCPDCLEEDSDEDYGYAQQKDFD